MDRLLEEAADELARLDTLCSLAPPAVARALWLTVVSALAGIGQEGAKGLAVIAADPASATTRLDLSRAVAWERFLAEEERRVRGGAPLTRNRLERAFALGLTSGPASAADIEPGDVSAPGYPALGRGAALVRALAVAAELDDRALADAAAALVLCAEGRTDVVRLLPFGDVREADRARAVSAWRGGDRAAWQSLALEAAARAARVLRSAVETAVREAPAREEEALERMGRAGITARRALDFLRDELATTVGTLGDALALSLPASGDALGRLASHGLATELTGRRRGRVYAYTAAFAAASSMPIRPPSG